MTGANKMTLQQALKILDINQETFDRFKKLNTKDQRKVLTLFSKHIINKYDNTFIKREK
jgi:hypothetical protein